jgi:hypothetical protein
MQAIALKEQIISSRGDDISWWNMKTSPQQFTQVGAFAAGKFQITTIKVENWGDQRNRRIFALISSHFSLRRFTGKTRQ